MSNGRVVVDTGVLLAAADADDAWHDQASLLLEDHPADQLVLPAPVAVESAWLIGSRLGPTTEAAFVASVAAGDFTLAELTVADWARCAALIDRYEDLDLGIVDSSIVAIAERLGSPPLRPSTAATYSSSVPPTAGPSISCRDRPDFMFRRFCPSLPCRR